MDMLEKVDLLRERFNIGYREAKEALDAAEGDVIQALVNLENCQQEATFSDKLQDKGKELVGQIKTAWHKTSKSKIKIKKGDETVLEIPAPLGALGVVGALASTELAVIGFLGAATAMAKKYTIEVDKKEEEPLTSEQWEEPVH